MDKSLALTCLQHSCLTSISAKSHIWSTPPSRKDQQQVDDITFGLQYPSAGFDIVTKSYYCAASGHCGAVKGDTAVKDNNAMKDNTTVKDNTVVKDNIEMKGRTAMKDNTAMKGNTAVKDNNTAMKDSTVVKDNTEMEDSTVVNRGSAVHYELGVPLETVQYQAHDRNSHEISGSKTQIFF